MRRTWVRYHLVLSADAMRAPPELLPHPAVPRLPISTHGGGLLVQYLQEAVESGALLQVYASACCPACLV